MKLVAAIIFTLMCVAAATNCRQGGNGCGNSGQRSKKPNIIFFLVDDMGWNDVGYHGMTQIPTPNIDTLAYNGIILNNYYTHPACSPSRSALLSGRLATSTGLQHLVILDAQRVGLPLNLKTMPQHLKCLGYKTHMVGKWHLGFYKKDFLPESRGFDTFSGFWNGDSDHFFHYTTGKDNASDFFGIPCYQTNPSFYTVGLSSHCGLNTYSVPGKYYAELYTEQVIDLIKRHPKNKPMFLYFAHHGVHRGNSYLPVRAPLPLTNLFPNINDSTRQNFAGALTAIDRSLGDMVECLDQMKMLDNTIIVFSADNGSPVPTEEETNGGSNYPLRGVKVTGWEGGVRTNSYIWAKDLKNKGTIYNGLMHIVDWLPTLYSAAGGNGTKLASDYKLDAIDHWEYITNNKPSPRSRVVLQNDTIFNIRSYRNGDMKIVMPGTYPSRFPDLGLYYGDTGRDPPPANFPKGSKTQRILSMYEDYKPTGNPILIDCGTGSMACNDKTQYCLYNITEDPCEMRNLAEQQPQVLQELIRELKEATKNDPAPQNPPLDYASNPTFYNGYWAPWADFPVNYNRTSC